MPLSQTEGDSRIPTLTNRDSNLPDLLWVSATSLSARGMRGNIKSCCSVIMTTQIDNHNIVSPRTWSILLSFSHPAQQRQQLAAVAHTQTQGVAPPPETFKLSFGLGVICNSSSPTYRSRWKLLQNKDFAHCSCLTVYVWVFSLPLADPRTSA